MNTKTDCEMQGIEFLRAAGVSFKAVWLDNAPYFEDDNESRDIYKITMSRGKRSFSLRFGQSLKNSVANFGIPPTAYDVLASITKSDPGSFEDFCGDFGYDTDSRKAEKTYHAVVSEWKKVSSFFTAQEIEKLQEIA